MKIHKAVIPIAGFGSRFFPASLACQKAWMPIVGQDGTARALLHYQIKDLIDAGIESICLVVQPHQQQAVLDYFQGSGYPLNTLLEKRPDLIREAQWMRGVLDRLIFSVQSEPEGYGHAVYQSRDFSKGDPVLLCLGDHLFRGRDGSCHEKLMKAFDTCEGRSVSAVNRIGTDDLRGYGTIAGQRTASNPDLIEVSLIIEKPSAETAREKLRVEGLEPDEFLGWFGMHALSPSIYDVLEEMISEGIRHNGEIQMTDAQELQRQREGYMALEMKDASRYDFGTPRDYAANLAAYAGMGYEG